MSSAEEILRAIALAEAGRIHARARRDAIAKDPSGRPVDLTAWRKEDRFFMTWTMRRLRALRRAVAWLEELEEVER